MGRQVKSEYDTGVSYEIQSRAQDVWEPRWNTFTLRKALSDMRDLQRAYRGGKFRIVKITRKVIAAK